MSYYINYIIEAGISLGVFAFVYWFILRKETRFTATRFYLLFALVFSTLLPFLSITINMPVSGRANYVESTVVQTNFLETVTVYASGIPQKIGTILLTFDYSILIYTLGAFVAAFVIFTGFLQLFRMLKGNRIFRLRKAKLIVSAKDISPYSFFNFIFISNKLTEQDNWKSMVHHELEHVRQGHTFDVLFVDIMMIFQWFNPFYWIIRRMVRENHEFLADTGVLKHGLITVSNYKKLLLSQAIGGNPVITSNFFSIKTIKKRFKMITNNTYNKNTWLRYTAGVMLATMLTFFLACESNVVNPSGNELAAYVYDGKVLSKSDFSKLGFDYVQMIKTDRSNALDLYPELRDDLQSDEVNLVFDIRDENQLQQAQIVQNQLSLLKSNKIKELMSVTCSLDKMKQDNEQVFVVVEEMPEYPGGEYALRQFLAQNVVYPQQAIKNGMQGRVFIEFVVGSDGKVRDARIARGVSSSIDEEALRVVLSMPKWIPGKQRGENVAVRYTVPINFVLQ